MLLFGICFIYYVVHYVMCPQKYYILHLKLSFLIFPELLLSLRILNCMGKYNSQHDRGKESKEAESNNFSGESKIEIF